ncbi:MAG: Holliday junction resolvase [Thermoplasmata archaeon]|nr:MAG: Holliday junction resolvase [Thermoplasmata archaeon]
MSASDYERELRSILRGDRKIIEIVTKTCSDEEKRRYEKIMEKPFVVVRSAGSYGADLLAVRCDISMLIEIKSSSARKIHFSSVKGKLQEQANRMKEECERASILPVYAFRLKKKRGDAWRIFTLDIKGLKGRIKEIHSNIPKLDLTRSKNLVMEWDKGLPLSSFIEMITG